MSPKPVAKPKQKTARPALPSEAEILEFVAAATGKVGKREIARAFNIRGDQRSALKDLLKQKKVAEDEERRAQEDIQKLTDRHIAEIDKMLQVKEADLMVV